MNIHAALKELCRLAPEEAQSSWDNSGVQIAGTAESVDKIAVTLEPTPEALKRCLDWGAQLVLAHHPLYMKPKAPSRNDAYTDVLRMVLGSGAWLYSAHTSLDVAENGPAFWLGESLKLSERRILEPAHSTGTLEVSFHSPVPLTREQAELWADWDGIHAVAQSNTGEVRIVADEDVWPSVAASVEFAMKEKPVYYVRNLAAPKRSVGFGEVGVLPQPMPFEEFCDTVAKLCGIEALTVSGPQPQEVRSVAYCGGSGSSLIPAAMKSGADVFVTGDMKYHPAVETELCTLDVGHFSLEEEMMRVFAGTLEHELEGVEVRFFKGVDPFRLHVVR